MSQIRSRLISLSSNLLNKNVFHRNLYQNQLKVLSFLSFPSPSMSPLQESFFGKQIGNGNVSSALINHCSKRYLAKNKDRKKETKKSFGHDAPKVILDDEEMQKVYDYDELTNKIEIIIDHFKIELRDSFNLRLNPRQIESIPIVHEDVKMTLGDVVAIIVKPNEFILNLQASPNMVKVVMNALLESGLDLNPQVDGHVIYIKMPKVTTEHRQSLIKNVRLRAQQVKDEIKDKNMHKKFFQEDYKKLSKDLLKDAEANLSYYIKKKSTNIDEMTAQKIDSLSNN